MSYQIDYQKVNRGKKHLVELDTEQEMVTWIIKHSNDYFKITIYNLDR